jgi:hypothetical protein
MKHQQLVALHHGQCYGCASTLTHIRPIGLQFRHKCLQQHCHCDLNLSVNWASAECQRHINRGSIMRQLSDNDFLLCNLHNPMAVDRCIPVITILATYVVKNPTNNLSTTSLNYVSVEWQQVLGRSISFTTPKCHGSFLNAVVVVNGQYSSYDALSYSTSLPPVSLWSYYCPAFSTRVNI